MRLLRCAAGLLTLCLLTLSLLLSPAAYAETLTRTSAFAYDSTSGLLTKEVIEPDDANLCLVTTYSYDGYGNRTGSTTRNCNGSSGEASSPSGDAVFASRSSSSAYASGTVTIGGTAYAYAAGQFATSSTNALSQSETRTFDARFGTVVSLTGPNSLATTWESDAFGRRTKETRADGTTTEVFYERCADLSGGTCPTYGVYRVRTVTSGAPTGSVYYDSLNREIRSETQGFDGTASRKDTEYDSQGRVYRTSRPYYAGGTVHWTTFSYDILGRVTQAEEPTVASQTLRTATTYNGLVTTVTVSNAGSGSGLPGSSAQTRTTTKNSQGQVVEVKDTQNNTLTYTYDPFGNLKTTTDALGNVATLSYDLRGRKTAMADPDMGAWSYRYNALGELIWQCDPVSRAAGSSGSPAECTSSGSGATATRMTYDLLGRMTQRIERDGVTDWYFDAYYGGGTCTKGVGKLCETRSDNGHARTVSYDSLGRVGSTTTTIDTSYTVSYSYDGSGRLECTTYPTGFPVKRVYNARGYLSELRNCSNNDLYWTAGSLTASGRVLTEQPNNGLTTTWSFDALERVTAVTTTAGSPPLHSLTYAYDTIGNVLTKTDNNQGITENFSYDNLNRLTQVSGSGLATRTFEYNAIGNLTYKSDAGSYTYPSSGSSSVRPHAVSSVSGAITASYSYDANGNLTSGNGRTLTWTSFNAPGTVSQGTDSFQYTYNGEHERVKLVVTRSAGTYTSVYLHPEGKGQLLYEKELKPGSVQEHKHYLTAYGRVVGMHVTATGTWTSGTGDTRYFYHDHLNSLVVVSDNAGAQLDRLGYEAFGERRYPAGTAQNRASPILGLTTDRGYTSHEHLDELNLIHMNGRIYDPALGRFMSADPFIQDPLNLQSLNRYSYGFNNPMAGTDPSGYFFKFIGRILDGVANAVEGAFQNPVRTAVTIAVAYYTGQYFGNAISSAEWAATQWSTTTFSAGEIIATSSGFTLTTAGAAAVGAAQGFTLGVLAGGDIRSGLRGALSGAMLSGIDGHYGGVHSLERVAAKAFGGGLAARAQGERFEDGFLRSAVNSGARYLYNTLVGYDVTAAPGENRSGPTNYVFDTSEGKYGRLYEVDRTRNVTGFNVNYDRSDSCFFCLNAWAQGSPISKALNVIPGINAISGIDDYLNNRYSPGIGDTVWFKLVTIPTGVLIAVPALLDRAHGYRLPGSSIRRR